MVFQKGNCFNDIPNNLRECVETGEGKREKGLGREEKAHPLIFSLLRSLPFILSYFRGPRRQ